MGGVGVFVGMLVGFRVGDNVGPAVCVGAKVGAAVGGMQDESFVGFAASHVRVFHPILAKLSVLQKHRNASPDPNPAVEPSMLLCDTEESETMHPGALESDDTWLNGSGSPPSGDAA